MSSTLKKAILVVSFGTSFEETRKRTIDVIEDEIRNAYPDYAIYTAWTSKMIIKKLATEFNIKRNTVSEAMQQMYEDGIQSVVIQPTHIIPGVENDIMTADALEFKDKFAKISFSTPLLATTEDNVSTIKAIMTPTTIFTNITVFTFLTIFTFFTKHTIFTISTFNQRIKRLVIFFFSLIFFIVDKFSKYLGSPI